MDFSQFDKIIIVHGIADDINTISMKSYVAKTFNYNKANVQVVDYEKIFDQSKLSKTNKALVAIGAWYLKAKYGFSAKGPMQLIRDKGEDIWLALNPMFKRSRNEALEKIELAVYGAKNPLVIGHSMGSVLARKACENVLELDNDADFSLITIGSPLWFPLVAKLIGLSTGEVFPRDWYNVWSKRDPVAAKPIKEKFGIIFDNQFDMKTSHAFNGYIKAIRQLSDIGYF